MKTKIIKDPTFNIYKDGGNVETKGKEIALHHLSPECQKKNRLHSIILAPGCQKEKRLHHLSTRVPSKGG